MRDLADCRQIQCEHVYTTQGFCVAAQTRLAGRAARLQELTGEMVGPRIAVIPVT
jgi:hypothetical protein